MNGLVPSCSYPAAEGMKIHTSTPTVLKTRKAIVELLLSNHPDDCLYCARNGKCDLANLAREHGVRDRVYRGERKRKEKDISSPAIVRDPEKCILCGKCVRVCEEIQGVSAIDFINRGSKAFVGTAFDEGMNVVLLHQLRPVHPGLPHRRPHRAQLRAGGAAGAGRPRQDRGGPARPGRLGVHRRGVRRSSRAPTSTARWWRPCAGWASTRCSTPRSPPT